MNGVSAVRCPRLLSPLRLLKLRGLAVANRKVVFMMTQAGALRTDVCLLQLYVYAHGGCDC